MLVPLRRTISAKGIEMLLLIQPFTLVDVVKQHAMGGRFEIVVLSIANLDDECNHCDQSDHQRDWDCDVKNAHADAFKTEPSKS
jgi:hypothetical protein